jgi:hypothetical protein
MIKAVAAVANPKGKDDVVSIENVADIIEGELCSAPR